MHRDPLGTAILLGMGGVTAELFKDTTMRLLPPDGTLTHDEALAMARDLVTWPLLDGFRGRPRACGNDLRPPDSCRFTVGDRNDAAEAVDVVSCGF